ncbi:hypothetical protein BV20DRAFT_979578 [Pilatotrama ljubarskyi]|nr:hypothetical protein BV20DRAFT_979578 [Pilatotrama ljubarskyi]
MWQIDSDLRCSDNCAGTSAPECRPREWRSSSTTQTWECSGIRVQVSNGPVFGTVEEVTEVSLQIVEVKATLFQRLSCLLAYQSGGPVESLMLTILISRNAATPQYFKRLILEPVIVVVDLGIPTTELTKPLSVHLAVQRSQAKINLGCTHRATVGLNPTSAVIESAAALSIRRETRARMLGSRTAHRGHLCRQSRRRGSSAFARLGGGDEQYPQYLADAFVDEARHRRENHPAAPSGGIGPLLTGKTHEQLAITPEYAMTTLHGNMTCYGERLYLSATKPRFCCPVMMVLGSVVNDASIRKHRDKVDSVLYWKTRMNGSHGGMGVVAQDADCCPDRVAAFLSAKLSSLQFNYAVHVIKTLADVDAMLRHQESLLSAT